MDFADIVQPIIDVQRIDQAKLGIKTEIPLAQLTSQQTWTMNVLKTVDKAVGTSNGKISDDEWKENLKKFMQEEIELDISILERLVLQNSKDFPLMHKIAQTVVNKAKKVGLMRMGMIIDTMAKSVT